MARQGIAEPIRRVFDEEELAGLRLATSARTVITLENLGHQSPIARIQRTLLHSLEKGETLEYPIRLPREHEWLIRYYFYDDFRIEEVPTKRRRSLKPWQVPQYQLWEREPL